MLSKNKLTDYVAILSIVLSSVSILISLESKDISRQANNIAMDANKISNGTNVISKKEFALAVDKRSQEYTDAAYTDIYENQNNISILEKIKNNNTDVTRSQLLSIVDVFEGVGSNFCQGSILLRHISTILRKTASYICASTAIYDNFHNEKNGLAILCYELDPTSKFASTIKMENINTCDFIDSKKFPNKPIWPEGF